MRLQQGAGLGARGGAMDGADWGRAGLQGLAEARVVIHDEDVHLDQRGYMNHAPAPQSSRKREQAQGNAPIWRCRTRVFQKQRAAESAAPWPPFRKDPCPYRRRPRSLPRSCWLRISSTVYRYRSDRKKVSTASTG